MTGYLESFVPAMRMALSEAASASGSADVPVGAIVLGPDGDVVARTHNTREATNDPTAHAEILALREAGRVAGGWRLTQYTLVVTLEPCAMCAGAVIASRLGRLVFGADDPKGGAVGSLFDVVRDPRLPYQPEVLRGVLADECGELLSSFFAARRVHEEPR